MADRAQRMAALRSLTKNVEKQLILEEVPIPKSDVKSGRPQQQIKPADNRYADVPDDVCISLTHKVTVWRDSELKNIQAYDVKQVDNDKAITYGQAVVNSLADGEVTADTVNMMLVLAVSLRRPGDISKHLLNALSTTQGAKITFADIVASGNTPSSSDTVSDFASRLSKAKAKIDISDNASSVSQDAQAAAYCYLSAYLMRLQCKTSENVTTNFQRMVSRYGGSYHEGKEVFENITLTAAASDKIKVVLERRFQITRTWVMWLACNENENSALTRNERGLLDYLGIQIFAYQGMRVVPQILDIQQTTNCKLDSLLREMECPMTRHAVNEVFKIIEDYETDKEPKRKTYFRYARVWGPGYFLKVQSKNCPELLYLAARTFKNLSPTSGSDPTQIFAVKSLGDAIKKRLDEVSDRLVLKLVGPGVVLL